MQLETRIPAVWVYTTASAYNTPVAGGGGSAEFLTKEQQARVERIRQARLLFRGRHRQYFLDEQRTQFDCPPVKVGARTVQLYLTLNVLKLISLKGADLLLGQEPLLRVEDQLQQGKLDDLVERTNLHAQLYDAAVACSYEAECFLEACARGGQVYLRALPADEVFPEGEMLPDRQYERYVRYSVANIGTEDVKVYALLETRYVPGSIERTLWQLGDDGKRKGELSLDHWPYPPADGTPLLPVTPTGIDRNTVTWIPNALDQGVAVSDYDGLIDLQDELNAKQSQIGRVLAKHSDPKIAFAASTADETGNVPASHDAFFFRTKEEIPQYIVWNAELEQARLDRSFTLNSLCITAEMSPVLLGLKEGAAPDAYRKLRLEAQNSLTKAQRKATLWKPGIRRAVGVCQDLEQTQPGTRYDRTPPAVEMRDGIPVDDLDQANTIATYRGAGVMSIERAVELQLGGDSESVDKEIAAIKKDAAAATPSVFLGGNATAAADTAGAAGGSEGATPPAPPSETGVAA